MRGVRTLPELDEASTAPLHGFRDADHYYQSSSAAGYLAGVRVPTLPMHALDDPFLPRRAVPVDAVARHPFLTGVFPESGGHVGFVSGTPSAPVFRAEREAARFLASRLAVAVGT